MGYPSGDSDNGNTLSEDKLMSESIQQTCQIRDRQIETLSERLTQVQNDQEKTKIIQELERVTGLKILHSQPLQLTFNE